MRTAFPTDPALPTLGTLSPADLSRITGAPHVDILRLRHHPGLRAALHVAFGAGTARREGVIWLLTPSKLRHLSRTRPHLRIDPASAAGFEPFPMDHRLPQLAAFLADAAILAPRLIGGAASAHPRLIRYRPGLCATFRWLSDTGLAHFVKVARKADTAPHAALQTALRQSVEGTALALPAVTGHLPDRGIIAYAAAQGEDLEQILARGNPAEVARATALLTEALGQLWSAPAPDLPALAPCDYLIAAQRAAQHVTEADAQAGTSAQHLLAQAAAAPPPLRQVPIHADLKPDHAFLEPTRVTLIDTESMKRGDPDFDLALLEARLALGPLTGSFPVSARDAAARVLCAAGGPNLPWFRLLARIHAAKFIAQRDGSAAATTLRNMLAP